MLNTQHVKFYLPLPVSLHFRVSAFIFFTLTLLAFCIIFAVIPHHIISSIQCIVYTALLKTLHGLLW